MSNDGTVKRQARLGRGLSSLMSGIAKPPSDGAADSSGPKAKLASPADVPENALESGESAPSDRPSLGSQGTVSLAAISPNPFQPRKQFDNASLAQLAESIRTAGVIQPVVVRVKPGHSDQYELIAGERRWRAAQLAGLVEIPAIVRSADDQVTAEWALIENLQREDLNPIDRGEAFQQLIDRYQLGHEQIAERVGVDRTTITNTLRLLGLQADVQQFVRDSLLSAGQARAIAGLSDQEAQRVLALQAVRQGWSVRRVEEEVRSLAQSTDRATKPGAPSRAGKAGHLADIERQVAEQLGTKVHIKAGRKKGTGSLTIDFYSNEQFEGLLEKLGASLKE
ncbi:MAG: ParB/RepB/Spo0J family partition protein [Phycisphaeraceae bacterium]